MRQKSSTGGKELRPKFEFDFSPCDLKINREHLLSMGIHSNKFGYFEAKGLKDIEWKAFICKAF